ncbi:YkvA family protein [Lihuaxuella thermophila]|uniref:Uncharacterized membrane protein YkvA, DUF1232 family n=1 Tax=Lihuaxuella thermophila TaxID=1173111 RepID=A0A1H8CD74_9BACL|nr:YkvA family protein [Lihuaxuella thermophila]SEM92384.1 Uncharacterized membrane protein YkvA, DUF1232 family [Lihuaxuella thermophila]
MAESTALQALKNKARQLKKQAYVLSYAYRDNRVAWYAKLFAICVVAYAFSPIDFIPDFIPVLGYLDDIIIVPLGIWLALKMIPEHVISDCAEKAEKLMAQRKPKNWVMGALIILIWITLAVWISWVLYQMFVT